MDIRRLYKINGFVKTDVGLVRHRNEDNFLLGVNWNPDSGPQMEASYSMVNELQWNCFCIFDGMGGADRGDLASRLAAQTAKEYVMKLKEIKECTKVDQIMQKIFLEANNRIVKERQNVSVCGTTGTVCVTDGIMMKIYHAGDSRAYLYREGQLYRLTKDQTVAQLKFDSGVYSSIQDASESEHHQLTEFIGRDETMKYFRAVEGSWIDFRVGDQVLLCSDGLYEQCRPDQISSILQQNLSQQEKLEKMMRIVFENGARDNVTCMLLEKQEEND